MKDPAHQIVSKWSRRKELNMINYFLVGLILTTIFVFLECYVHELIYEDGAYKTPFNILGAIWGV